MELYTCQDVSVDYNGRSVLTLKDMVLHKGKIYGITGPNGSGKTTLIKLLNFLVPVYRGKMLYQGKEIAQFSERDKLSIRRRMAAISQKPIFFYNKTVEQNLLYGAKVQKIAENHYQKRYEKLLEDFSLTNLLFRYPENLSGGELQRMSIARAFLLEHDILFMDEPYSYLDNSYIPKLEEWILSFTSISSATLFITYHAHHPIYSKIDKTITMSNGEFSFTTPISSSAEKIK